MKNKLDIKTAVADYAIMLAGAAVYATSVVVFTAPNDIAPGGLTSSEALAKGIPMVISNPIPGQEDRNVEFLLNAGAAIKVSPTYPIDDALIQLFSDNRLRLIQETIKQLGKPNSTQTLIDFVKENCK